MNVRMAGPIAVAFMLQFSLSFAAAGDSSMVSVTSVPSPVNVYCDSVFIGITPLAAVPLPSGVHVITAVDGTPFRWDARRENRTVVCEPDSSVTLHFDFTTDSSATPAAAESIEKIALVQPRELTLHPMLIAGGGMGLLGGIASAYCKMRADAKYNDYIATGNGEALRQTRRLDTLAGVTLGLSQIGLALVAYYLLSE